MSAKVEVFAFNILGAGLADEVKLRIDELGVTFPLVGIELIHIARRKFLAQLSATGIGAPSQHKRRDASCAPVEGIPEPILLFFVLDKRPSARRAPASISSSLMRGGTRGSGVVAAARRNTANTVVGLMRKTRAMSRTPEPLSVIGTTNSRSSGL